MEPLFDMVVGAQTIREELEAKDVNGQMQEEEWGMHEFDQKKKGVREDGGPASSERDLEFQDLQYEAI